MPIESEIFSQPIRSKGVGVRVDPTRGLEDLAFDEEAAIEIAQERSAVPHLLKREHDELLKREPTNARVEKRMLELDEMIACDLRKN